MKSPTSEMLFPTSQTVFLKGEDKFPKETRKSLKAKRFIQGKMKIP